MPRTSDRREPGRTPSAAVVARLLVPALLAVPLLLAAVVATASAASAPHVWLTALGGSSVVHEVRAGSYVDVHVSGFAPRTVVAVRLGSAPLPGQLRTAASGSGVLSVRLSSAYAGVQPLRARAGARSAVSAVTLLPDLDPRDPVAPAAVLPAARPAAARAAAASAPASRSGTSPAPAAGSAPPAALPAAPAGATVSSSPLVATAEGSVPGAGDAPSAAAARDPDTGELLAAGSVRPTDAPVLRGAGLLGVLVVAVVALAVLPRRRTTPSLARALGRSEPVGRRERRVPSSSGGRGRHAR